MEKIIVSVAAVTIILILILLLASCLWYKYYIPAAIKFCEIDFVHYTDNNTNGLSGQKALVGYRGKKSYFPSKKIFQGFYSYVHCFTGGKKTNIFNG